MTQKLSTVDVWLANVAHGHSGSVNTEIRYRQQLDRFCKYVGTTPEEICAEYARAENDKPFRLKWGGLLKTWIAQLEREDLTNSTIDVMACAVKSFFKYNDLPLGFIPKGKKMVTYHNRSITSGEIEQIINNTQHARDKAYFAFMAQSGLRPDTIQKLRLKNLMSDLGYPDRSKAKIPCKVDVPQEITKGKYRGYFTFIGPEAVAYLYDYFEGNRKNLNPESLLFVLHGKDGIGKEGEVLDRKNITHRFRAAADRLRKTGAMQFEQQKKGKPSEIRMYNLRKWFRDNAAGAGTTDFVQFWMGHVLKNQDEAYFGKDNVEKHRVRYASIMDDLKIGTKAPTNTDKVIEEQRQEIDKLKEEVGKLQKLYDMAENKVGVKLNETIENTMAIQNKWADLEKRLDEFEADKDKMHDLVRKEILDAWEKEYTIHLEPKKNTKKP